MGGKSLDRRWTEPHESGTDSAMHETLEGLRCAILLGLRSDTNLKQLQTKY